MLDKDPSHFVYWVATEGSTILLFACEHTCFSRDQFNHFAYSHSTWEPVRIHYKVRTPAIAFTKRHVFSRHYQPNNTFLSMARAEFVANFWHSRLSCDHFDDAFFFIVRCEYHAIDIDMISALEALLFRSV